MTVNVLLAVGSGKLINNPGIYVFRKSDKFVVAMTFVESNSKGNQRSLEEEFPEHVWKFLDRNLRDPEDDCQCSLGSRAGKREAVGL